MYLSEDLHIYGGAVKIKIQGMGRKSEDKLIKGSRKVKINRVFSIDGNSGNTVISSFVTFCGEKNCRDFPKGAIQLGCVMW
ncbi:MAG: hypothetical protein JSW38_11450 [Dehalococcoidia bacterium]|nr:MAG: hypothetical protein JSW38_11450 [Dehalococcoidia bacterium]